MKKLFRQMRDDYRYMYYDLINSHENNEHLLYYQTLIDMVVHTKRWQEKLKDETYDIPFMKDSRIRNPDRKVLTLINQLDKYDLKELVNCMLCDLLIKAKDRDVEDICGWHFESAKHYLGKIMAATEALEMVTP